jgi:hypothetical protein
MFVKKSNQTIIQFECSPSLLNPPPPKVQRLGNVSQCSKGKDISTIVLMLTEGPHPEDAQDSEGRCSCILSLSISSSWVSLYSSPMYLSKHFVLHIKKRHG